MSRAQKADDPALNMRAVWLGPKSMRWPFDATFTEWKVAAVLTLALALVMTLVLPAIVPVALLAWGASAVPGKFLVPDHQRAVTIGLVVMWLLLAVLFVPSPMAWITPMPLLLSLALAPVGAVLVTRRIGRFITGNRPLGYWLSLLGRVARGPRADEVREYRVLAITEKEEPK